MTEAIILNVFHQITSLVSAVLFACQKTLIAAEQVNWEGSGWKQEIT